MECLPGCHMSPVPFPLRARDYGPMQSYVNGTWGWGCCTNVRWQPPIGRPKLKGAPREGSHGVAHSKNQPVAASMMAGTETGTNETRRAGGSCVLVKLSGNPLPSPSGTACHGVALLSLYCLCPRERGREAPPPSLPSAEGWCIGRAQGSPMR